MSIHECIVIARLCQELQARKQYADLILTQEGGREPCGQNRNRAEVQKAGKNGRTSNCLRYDVLAPIIQRKRNPSLGLNLHFAESIPVEFLLEIVANLV